SRDVAPRIAELVGSAGECHLGTVWRVLGNHAVRNESRDVVVHQCCSGANNGLAASGRIVYEAKSRGESVEPAIGEGMVHAGVAGEKGAEGRIRVDPAGL